MILNMRQPIIKTFQQKLLRYKILSYYKNIFPWTRRNCIESIYNFYYHSINKSFWFNFPNLYHFLSRCLLVKFNNGKSGTLCEICSKLITKTSERRATLLLTLNGFHTFFWLFNSLLWTSKCRLDYLWLKIH